MLSFLYGPRRLRYSFCWAYGMGLPYISSNAFNFNLSFVANPMQKRTIWSNVIQFSWVFWCSLAKAHFKIWLYLSNFPSGWLGFQGWEQGPFYAQGICYPLITWDTNAGLLSLCQDPRSPNLGIISFSLSHFSWYFSSSRKGFYPPASTTWNCLVLSAGQ